MKAFTLCFMPHLSFGTFWPLPTKPPLSRFLQCLGFYLASPMLVGNAAVQGARPRSCGRTLCPSTTPPSPRDGQPLLLNRPGQESFFSTNCFVSP